VNTIGRTVAGLGSPGVSVAWGYPLTSRPCDLVVALRLAEMVTGEAAAAYASTNHPCPIGQFPVGQVGKLIK
jgi:hypothetical protein